MCDGGSERGFSFSSRLIEMNPLMITRDLRKGSDTILRYCDPAGCRDFLAYHGSKLIDRD
jgi:hypothetical protein